MRFKHFIYTLNLNFKTIEVLVRNIKTKQIKLSKMPRSKHRIASSHKEYHHKGHDVSW